MQAIKRDIAPVVYQKRQQSNVASSSKFNLNFPGTQGNTATTNKNSKSTNSKATKTNSNNNNNNNNDPSGAASSSAAPTGKNGKTTGKNGDKTGTDKGKQTTKAPSTTKTFDARLPAGGLSMITPAIINGPQYYRISDFVTFAWNFTSLKVTPTAVDVLATCSTNSATYTIALNQTIKGPTQAVTWDTGEYQATATIPLLIATYTLIVYDAASDVTASPRAGYLGAWDQFTFGMYTPQPYKGIEDFVCATCNAASSSMVTHTVSFMLGMCALTVLSFGWFVGVAGLW
jgi:hypothetical protein